MAATIVVGLDGSPAAQSAGRIAGRLAGRSDVRLVLTGVSPPVPPFSAPALPGVERVTRSMVRREYHAQLLVALRRYRVELGLSDALLRAEVGAPAEQLMSVADAEDAELIVVGTRGQGAARAAMLGTVAGDLLANSPVPVLAVPADAADAEIQCIVCGVVDSAESTLVAVIAERLARDLGCALVLVHVVVVGEDAAQAEALLSSVADVLDAPGDVQRVVRNGAVAAELAAVADERGPAIIAVGSRGRGAVRAALGGSTSRDILSFGRFALLATPPAAVDRLLAKSAAQEDQANSDVPAAATRFARSWSARSSRGEAAEGADAVPNVGRMPGDPCFATVIVGIDGASGGRDAFGLVRLLAPDAERVILVSVDLSDPLGAVVAGGAERQAAAFFEAARTAGPEVVVRVATAGTVADGLAGEARRCGADLIVVGSSQRGRVMRVLLGDDTRDILHQVPCAVAVAPLGFAEGSPNTITTIGVGYGTDGASARAIALAQQLKSLEGSLRLTHVVQRSPVAVNPLTGVVVASARMQASERLAALEGFDEQNVTLGSVRDGLLELAQGVDLLVVGLHHQSALGRLLHGSTADELLHDLPCPLLAVPELPLHAPIALRSR